jgi:hypothetical protein
MGTITGLTAAAMQAIVNGAMKTAAVVGDDLIITKNDLTTIDAGSVRGPQGVPGTSPPAGVFSPAVCNYWASAAQTIVPSPVTRIPLTTAIFPQVGGFSLSGGGILIPTAGVYDAKFLIGVSSAPFMQTFLCDHADANLLTGPAFKPTVTAYGTVLVGTGLVKVAAGEILRLEAQVTDINAPLLIGSLYNWISLSRVA